MNLVRGCGYRLFTGLTSGHPAIWRALADES
jgi:hypothetical protein